MSGRVEILAVGTELLVHGRVDTNSAELGQRLARLGFRVERAMSVGDDVEDLSRAFREATERAPLVLSTGGLGPTGDDRTRDALARAFARKLRQDPAILRELEERFQRHGMRMPRSNRRQAEVPEGAELLPNPEGTAPGLWLEHPGGLVVALPGPPSEMRAVLDARVVRRIQERFRPPAMASRVVRTAGIVESAVEDLIGGLPFDERGAQLTILARPGLVEALIRVPDADAARGERVAAELARDVAERLGEHVFATEPISLPAALGERLRGMGRTLAVAESCTGGLLGAELTRPPGASDYFLGGVTAYANRIKEEALGVPAAVVRAHGAVSEETAIALAQGVRARFNSDYGLAVTGVAGPGGGSSEKPVGRVYHAVTGASGTDVRCRDFPGGRDRVRTWAVAAALDLLRRRLDRDASA